MRCPDCNKFVSENTDEDPEFSIDAWMEGDVITVSGTVSIINTCAECGTELRTASFDTEATIFRKKDAPAHCGSPDIDESDIDAERTEETKGKVRYFGYRATVPIRCSGCEEVITEIEISDQIAASDMDSAV